jgi:hypothetical protein
MPAVEPLEPFRARSDRDPPPALPGGNTFWRAVTAHALAKAKRSSPAAEAARLWPSDKLTLRAVSVAATSGNAPWAGELAHRVVRDALEGMGPAAAGAQVLLRSLVLAWDNYGSISAPGFVAGAGSAGFVAENAPIPVRQLSATAALLTQFKLAALAVLTREMIESSNAEQLITDVLVRSAAAALDAALFSTTAATAAQPAGIRYNVTALTASAATDPFEQIPEDIANLINAVAPVGGDGPYLMIGSPGRIAALIIRFAIQGDVRVDFLASNAVGNDLLCVAPNALVCALAPEPEIDTSTAGELHMNDTPLPLVDSGGVVASPSKSMFQVESVALKMRWPVSWAVRDARACAWTTPTWK